MDYIDITKIGWNWGFLRKKSTKLLGAFTCTIWH